MSANPPHSPQDRLAQLRRWRNHKEVDLSLAFVQKQFQHQVERPHKQLAQIVTLWEALLPSDLARHTRLDSYKTGVLRVSVDNSARLYTLDRLLRSGLQQKLTVSLKKGPALRRILLQVNTLD